MTSQLFFGRRMAAPLLCAASMLASGPVAAQYLPPSQPAAAPYSGYSAAFPPQYAQYGDPSAYAAPGSYPVRRLATAQFPSAYGQPPAGSHSALIPNASLAQQETLPSAPSPSDAPHSAAPYLPGTNGQQQPGYPQANYPGTYGATTGAANYAGNHWSAGPSQPGGGCGPFDPWANYRPFGGCGQPWGCNSPLGNLGGWGCGPGKRAGVGACGPGGGAYCPPPCRQWFGGVYGLYMDHDDENQIWLSFDSTILDSRLLGSRDGATSWHAGNEIRFGSTMVRAPYAWEIVYWGLYEESATGTVTATQVGNPIATSLDFSGLDYDPGGGASGLNSFFDGAEAHRVRRHWELQNVELNLIKFPLLGCVGPCGIACGPDANCAAGGLGGYANAAAVYGGGGGGLYGQATPCGPRFTVVGIAGVRYVRVDEGFQFATSDTDANFGNEAADVFYNIEVENHFVGAQLGCACNYQHSCRLSLYADTKFGVYQDFVDHDSRIFGSNGFAVVAGGLPFAGQAYNVQSEKEDVAFIGEARLGAAYLIRPHWRFYGGWRAVAISNIALPTNQMPQNFADIPGVAIVESNGSLIVHGLQAGLEVNY